MIPEELRNFIEQNCSGKDPSDLIMEAIGQKIEQLGADADEVLAFVEEAEPVAMASAEYRGESVCRRHADRERKRRIAVHEDFDLFAVVHDLETRPNAFRHFRSVIEPGLFTTPESPEPAAKPTVGRYAEVVEAEPVRPNRLRFTAPAGRHDVHLDRAASERRPHLPRNVGVVVAVELY